jgi:hypothetical protein
MALTFEDSMLSGGELSTNCETEAKEERMRKETQKLTAIFKAKTASRVAGI